MADMTAAIREARVKVQCLLCGATYLVLARSWQQRHLTCGHWLTDDRSTHGAQCGGEFIEIDDQPPTAGRGGVRMDIKLRRWQAPNYVSAEMPVGQRQDGLQQPPTWHVRGVDADTLSILCDQFREDVFAKSKKADPRLRQAGGGQ